jgi:hypothetical protein
MEQRKLHLSLNLMLVIYSFVPMALLVAFYSFVVRARLELGRWPVPMRPDPKSLPFARDHMDAVFWLFVFSLCCFAPWMLMACFRKQLIPETRFFPTLTLFALPWLLLAVACLLDPGRFVEWFLD